MNRWEEELEAEAQPQAIDFPPCGVPAVYALAETAYILAVMQERKVKL